MLNRLTKFVSKLFKRKEEGQLEEVKKVFDKTLIQLITSQIFYVCEKKQGNRDLNEETGKLVKWFEEESTPVFRFNHIEGYDIISRKDIICIKVFINVTNDVPII